jgi:hypothetical protein
VEHAWCLDVARDAAVRAAEDGRTAPLPTLGEAIAAPFACSACGGFGMDHRCRESCGECAPGGMTTERVTLEITTFVGCVPAGWPWREIMGGMAWIHPGESVRVVEEAVGSVDDRAYADRIGCDEERDFANRILAERDAAIRERDAAVAESERRLRLCETMKRDGDSARFHAAVAQARVAELEAASGGGEGEPVAWRVEYRGFIELYSVEQFATERASEVRGTVVPLYRSPPQPRGWLTGEERTTLTGVVELLRDLAKVSGRNTADRCELTAVALDALFARSSPPEVVLTEAFNRFDTYGDRVASFDAHHVRKALAAAGVAVKEVGK